MLQIPKNSYFLLCFSGKLLGPYYSSHYITVNCVCTLLLLLEKEMATQSSILAWSIPGTEEPSGLPSMGSHRVGHDWSDLAACSSWIVSELLDGNVKVMHLFSHKELWQMIIFQSRNSKENMMFLLLPSAFSMPCLVTQSCLTLCNPMDCSPPGSSVHGDSPGKNTGVGCHALLQGIFPTQVSCVAGRFFTVWATREAQEYWSG